MYDATRGLTIAVAAGLAGLLLWLATQVGQTSTPRFWIEMGIVAAAGLVLSLAQVLGSWTKGLRLRISPGTFVLGFVPVLVCVGWILMATQPGSGWHEAKIVSWSHDAGLMGVVHSLGLWHGVLAFGFGLVLGMTFDTVPVEVPADEAVAARGRRRRAPMAPGMFNRNGVDEPVANGGRRRRAPMAPGLFNRRTADEPVTAEQREVPADRAPVATRDGTAERTPETTE
jgi:hypothetical protein